MPTGNVTVSVIYVLIIVNIPPYTWIPRHKSMYLINSVTPEYILLDVRQQQKQRHLNFYID